VTLLPGLISGRLANWSTIRPAKRSRVTHCLQIKRSHTASPHQPAFFQPVFRTLANQFPPLMSCFAVRSLGYLNACIGVVPVRGSSPPSCQCAGEVFRLCGWPCRGLTARRPLPVQSTQLNRLCSVSPVPMYSAHLPHTSYKQHLALLLNRPYARLLLLLLFLCHKYCLFDVAENEVAMRIVCLKVPVSFWRCASLVRANIRAVCPSIRDRLEVLRRQSHRCKGAQGRVARWSLLCRPWCAVWC